MFSLLPEICIFVCVPLDAGNGLGLLFACNPTAMDAMLPNRRGKSQSKASARMIFCDKLGNYESF